MNGPARCPTCGRKWHLTMEHRRTLSAAKKSRPMSQEAIERMRASLTGRKLTDEHRQNISKAMRRLR